MIFLNEFAVMANFIKTTDVADNRSNASIEKKAEDSLNRVVVFFSEIIVVAIRTHTNPMNWVKVMTSFKKIKERISIIKGVI